MLSTEQESITEQLIQAIRDGSLEEVKKNIKRWLLFRRIVATNVKGLFYKYLIF